MERELTTAKTYEDLRRVITEAEALKILLGHVAEVKAQAEDTILVGSTRIGEEIKKVPKAASGRRAVSLARAGKSTPGRAATGLPGTSRSRLTKLADAGTAKVKQVATQLRAIGKDATPRAVATFLTQGDKKERRAARERELGTKQRALPDKKYGVILEDYEWDFLVRSRETGMDRHAANHYPTSETAHTPQEIIERTKDRFAVAAVDCVLFQWVPIPFLAIGLHVLEGRGFTYKSSFVWGKDKIGPGYWNREKHEYLLIGVKGKIPAPAEGTQFDSLIMALRGAHSEKPDFVYDIIERYFPTLPKIELNLRGAPRPGWDGWGNEAEAAA
ncbi:MAG: hypothetical protein J2P55_00210 [Rhizobiales bacterium]|nr:hypothetical protein [Hyphomicrobiales bacterium]